MFSTTSPADVWYVGDAARAPSADAVDESSPAPPGAIVFAASDATAGENVAATAERVLASGAEWPDRVTVGYVSSVGASLRSTSFASLPAFDVASASVVSEVVTCVATSGVSACSSRLFAPSAPVRKHGYGRSKAGDALAAAVSSDPVAVAFAVAGEGEEEEDAEGSSLFRLAPLWKNEERETPRSVASPLWRRRRRRRW